MKPPITPTHQTKRPSVRLLLGIGFAIMALSEPLEAGDPAVADVVRLIASGERRDGNQMFGYDARKDGFVLGMETLLKASPETRRESFIPALQSFLGTSRDLNARLNVHHALALIDPVYRDTHELPGKTDVKPEFHRRDWEWVLDPRSNKANSFYSIARSESNVKYASMIADALRKNEAGSTYHLGMVMNNLCGAEGIPELLKLLDDPEWYPRWAATGALQIMGEKAHATLPKLEAILADEDEEVLVRVGAARAIARIRNVDPFTLYGKIDNLEKAVIGSTREKAAAWRKHFVKREGAAFTPSGTREDVTRATYALLTGQHAAEADRYLRESFAAWMNGKGPRALDAMYLIRPLVMFREGSVISSVRLRPETERQMKETAFGVCNARLGWTSRYIHDTQKILAAIELTGKESELALGINGNGNLPPNTFNYLAASLLKDDPLYRDRKFDTGDTPLERYEAFKRYFMIAYRNWALNGLTRELGCTGYEAYTWSAHFMLVDLAPDPEVRKLSKMYLDVAMVEREQSTLSGFRAGAKSRPKAGEFGHLLTPMEVMPYGERGNDFSWPVACNGYEAPDAAILLRNLGSPVSRFETLTRYTGKANEQEIYFHVHFPSFLYSYRTPEYVTGSLMSDPNNNITPGLICHALGVWFRDLEAISLPGFYGGKWTVQSKDAMITQRLSGTYFGRPLIEFTAGLQRTERDGWVFASNGKAYAAIRMVVGGYVWERNPKTLLRLWPNDVFSPIIIQTGMAEDHGSFEDFQQKVLKAPLQLEYTPDESHYDGKRLTKVTYAGPGSAELTLFADVQNHPCWPGFQPKEPWVLPLIAGQPVNLGVKTNYSSPFLQGDRDSTSVTLSYGAHVWTYDFKQAAVLAENEKPKDIEREKKN